MSGNKIGRPKKNVSLDESAYHRIVDTPRSNTSVIEFDNTEPFNMSKFFKTIKSNKVEVLQIECLPNKITFWGEMMPKDYSLEYKCNSKNNMYLIYDCNNIYRYYCARPTYISISDKESIINLLGEISESIRKIKMVVDNKITDRIDFIVINGTLHTKDVITVRCNIEFDKPMRIPEKQLALPDRSGLYCEMKNMDIGECKKNLSTKFKKKVVDSRIQFIKGENDITKDTVIIQHMKNLDKKINTIYRVTNGNVAKGEQDIILYSDGIVETKFPKNSIVNFLLHIRGKFRIAFYKDVTILMYVDEKKAMLISELAIDSI